MGLGDVDADFFGCGLDAVEGLFAVFVGDALDLVEARDGVADVRGVFDGLFALVGEGVVGGVDVLAIFGGEVWDLVGMGGAPGTALRRRASCRLVGLDVDGDVEFGCGEKAR